MYIVKKSRLYQWDFHSGDGERTEFIYSCANRIQWRSFVFDIRKLRLYHCVSIFVGQNMMHTYYGCASRICSRNSLNNGFKSSKSLLCAMLRLFSPTLLYMPESGRASRFSYNWCDFPPPDVTFVNEAVPLGWCDFSRLMWLKYGGCKNEKRPNTCPAVQIALRKKTLTRKDDGLVTLLSLWFADDIFWYQCKHGHATVGFTGGRFGRLVCD